MFLLYFLEASATISDNTAPGLWRWTGGLHQPGPRDHHPLLGHRCPPWKTAPCAKAELVLVAYVAMHAVGAAHSPW